MNVPAAAINRSACLERSRAPLTTSLAASLVLLAAWITPTMLAITCCVLADVWCTFRAISEVAAPCLLDREHDVRCGLTDFLDCRHDAMDGRDGLPGSVLDLRDLVGDLLGRFRRPRCRRLHFEGGNGEALARIPGLLRPDRCVQRQQVGLPGDGGDQADA